MHTEVPQPPPLPSSSTPVWDLVIADMKARDDFGLAKYGTRLTADNGRDHLEDAYDEAQDLTVYLRAELEKRRNHFAEGWTLALKMLEDTLRKSGPPTDIYGTIANLRAPALAHVPAGSLDLTQMTADRDEWKHAAESALRELDTARGLEVCAYCEKVFDSNAEVREHVLTCDKHPLSAMAKKLSKARRLLKKYKKAAADLETTQALADDTASVLATTKNENAVLTADLAQVRYDYTELKKQREADVALARANEAQLVKENASKVSSRDLQDALDIQNSLRETIKGLNERLNTVTSLYAEAKEKLEALQVAVIENKKPAPVFGPYQNPQGAQFKALQGTPAKVNGHMKYPDRSVFCPTRGNAHVRTQYSLFDGPKEICSACGGEL